MKFFHRLKRKFSVPQPATNNVITVISSNNDSTIIVNGKVYHGNVKIVDGEVVGDIVGGKVIGDFGDGQKTETVRINETQKESVIGINTIRINSNIRIEVSADSSLEEVTATLIGDCNGEKPTFFIKRAQNEVQIIAKKIGKGNTDFYFSNVSIMSSNIVSSNNVSYVKNGLVLRVQLPARMFDSILIENTDGNTYMDSSVKAETINISSEDGNVDVNSIFHNLVINSDDGNIKVASSEKANLIDISSNNGRIILSAAAVCINIHGRDGNINVSSELKSDDISIESVDGRVDVNSLFENLKINSLDGNVTVVSSIPSSNINITSVDGRVEVNSAFKKLDINGKDGNVKVTSIAKSDMKLNIHTIDGSIDVSLKNIACSKLSISSDDGHVFNSLQLTNSDYTVTGRISSSYGNVKLH